MGTETRLVSIASELSSVFKREAKELSGESDILQQGRGFMSEMGGAEQLGRCLAEDFKAARDAGNKTVVLGFHKLATALAEKSDAARQAISALSDVPDEDLHAALAEAAIALLINDQRFFEAAVVNVHVVRVEALGYARRPASRYARRVHPNHNHLDLDRVYLFVGHGFPEYGRICRDEHAGTRLRRVGYAGYVECDR